MIVFSLVLLLVDVVFFVFVVINNPINAARPAKNNAKSMPVNKQQHVEQHGQQRPQPPLRRRRRFSVFSSLTR